MADKESGPTRQRHMMGEGEGPMAGGNFGVAEYPSRATAGNHGAHMPHDGVHLKDEARANGPGIDMGAGNMTATRHSHHGPHGHKGRK